MLNNFEKVKEFNTIFEAESIPEPDKSVFEKNPKLVQHRMNLITEEFEELQQAVRDHDLCGVVDAIADLEYVLHGMSWALALDSTEAFKIVHESNMSKLCKTEDEAKATVANYKTDSRYKDPSYRLTIDGSAYIVYDKITNKVLKSINYIPADLSSIVEPK